MNYSRNHRSLYAVFLLLMLSGCANLSTLPDGWRTTLGPGEPENPG